MSIPAGQIVETTLQAMNRTTSREKRDQVWACLNAMYFQLCRQHPFQDLRRSVELDFTSAGDGGLWLPSNLYGIRRVRDEDSKIEFLPADDSELEPGDDNYRYYTLDGSDTDLFFSDDASISSGESLIVCDSLTADHTGEYVRFASTQGYYLLTGAKTISPTYYGPTIESKEIRIRPSDTKKLVIVDGNEEELHDRTVRVFYWQAPSPLYRDSDMPVLPDSDVLQLMVLQAMPEAKSRRPVSQQDVDAARARCFSLSPDNPRANRPRDVLNRPMTLAQGGMYGRRR